MNLILILGAGAGAGVLLVASALIPARPPLSLALAQLHRLPDRRAATQHDTMFVRLVGRPFVSSQPGSRFARWIERDLRVTGQRAEELVAKQFVCAFVGLTWAPVTVALMTLGGVSTSLILPVWLSLVLAGVGFVAPLLALRNAAAERRRGFRHALGCFLDLSAVRLAGGAGIESALELSAASGQGWAFGELRQALAEARLRGEPPWAGLDRLGTALDVRELNELAASVALAGDEGARIRRSISAKARTIRTRALAESESEAQAASERMSLPIVLLMLGFVIFLGYPAVNQVLTGI